MREREREGREGLGRGGERREFPMATGSSGLHPICTRGYSAVDWPVLLSTCTCSLSATSLHHFHKDHLSRLGPTVLFQLTTTEKAPGPPKNAIVQSKHPLKSA